ncbi:MAG TPA: hypothetical protein VFQ62_07535 [Methylomirabilota bacterium]|nr:hypothetical protein [Methylomirabilota bacterium]
MAVFAAMVGGNEHINLETYELCCQLNKPLRLAFGVAPFDRDVVAFDVAGFT